MMKLLKVLAGAAAALALLLGGAAAWFWLSVLGPEEYGPRKARESASNALHRVDLKLAESDAVEHGWQDHHWLDSRQFFLIRSTPERVGEIRQAILAQDGKEWSGWKTSVSRAGPGCGGPSLPACPKDHPDPSEKLPPWWKVSGLKDVEVLSVERQRAGAGVNGVQFILSVPEGAVFVLVWST